MGNSRSTNGSFNLTIQTVGQYLKYVGFSDGSRLIIGHLLEPTSHWKQNGVNLSYVRPHLHEYNRY